MGASSEWKARFLSGLYTAALGAAGTLAAPWLPLVSRTRKGRSWWLRFGQLPEELRRRRVPGLLWIHAASVGEVRSAARLVELWRERRGFSSVVVSATSEAGVETARRELGVGAFYLPFDLPWTWKKCFEVLEPVALAILETEIWPNLLRAAAERGVPVVWVGARLRDERPYRLFRPLLASRFACVRFVLARAPEDARRFARLGVAADRIRVGGDLKLSRLFSEKAFPPPFDARNRPLLVGASTHAPEEAVLLEAARTVRRRFPRALLLLAPRRPERFGEVARLLDAAPVPWCLRSRMGGCPPEEAEVVLWDSVGDLARVFPMASASFVGGTLAPLGGHNLLEPVLGGSPVCFGPATWNVREFESLLLRTGAGRRVENARELGRAWLEMLESSGAWRERVRSAAEEVRSGPDPARLAFDVLLRVAEEGTA
ncbi:MAG: 3-deoxy-D-manno-octulosonic acid transferase [Candidatus Binatia bacterium]|nr:MAG: 3-deoxy-D-manno-octulosonic acid transferase [Candidatus Binatia bacterium]